MRFISLFKIVFILLTGLFSMLPETPAFQEYLEFHKSETLQRVSTPKRSKRTRLRSWLPTFRQIRLLEKNHFYQALRWRKYLMEFYQIFAPRGHILASMKKQTGSIYYSFLSLA